MSVLSPACSPCSVEAIDAVETSVKSSKTAANFPLIGFLILGVQKLAARVQTLPRTKKRKPKEFKRRLNNWFLMLFVHVPHQKQNLGQQPQPIGDKKMDELLPLEFGLLLHDGLEKKHQKQNQF